MKSAAVASFLFLLSQQPAPPPPKAAIEGVVVRVGTGEPIEGAQVTAGSDRTDDRGEYRLYWVTPGRYYLLAGSGPHNSACGVGRRIGQAQRSSEY